MTKLCLYEIMMAGFDSELARGGAKCGMRNAKCRRDPPGVPAFAAADRAGRRDASGTTYTNKSGPSWLLLSCISPVITGNSLPTTHVLANQRVTRKKDAKGSNSPGP